MSSVRWSAVTGVATAACGTATLLAWGTPGPLERVTAAGPASFEDLLALSAAAAAWAAFGWLVSGLLLSMAAATLAPGGSLDRLALAITPRAVRRLAALLLGLGLVGAPVMLALPAQAAPLVATSEQPGLPPAVSDGLPALERWSPDRPARPPRSGPSEQSLALLVSRPHREQAVTDHIVVRRGDTLWDIAARALGPNPSVAEIAASWPRWHAANRSTIGPDPDLILPGQLLRPPGT
jgi:nucleoid-associated protein YgaU